MKNVALLFLLLCGCTAPEQVGDVAMALGAICPANCDPATPPQCMSLSEAQPLATSPNFAPWFTQQICPQGVDIGGAKVQLVPWFCDSEKAFPGACMPVFGKTPTVALHVACCHPAGAQLTKACTADEECPLPQSECFVRYCAPTGVCAIAAKQEGAELPCGTCKTDSAELCPYSGPPPVCM